MSFEKKSILWAVAGIALLTAAVWSANAAEKPVVWELRVWQKNLDEKGHKKIAYVDTFLNVSDCLVAGMSYKKEGFTFDCVEVTWTR